MNKFLLISLAVLLFSACNSKPGKESTPVKPNIVYILADDLGYGDLSCYGQTHFQTPNIDQLAKTGMRFTQHYAGTTVCAPSRSALMTGQTTGHTPIRGNRGWNPEGQWPLPADAFTLAEMLQQNGYTTGGFGKWGLGYVETEGDPNKQGFDEFMGFNCQSLGHHYYPYYLWHNHEKVMLEGNAGTQKGEYAPAVIHQYAMKFLEDNKDKPFFMYYPTIIPHAELTAPEEYMEKYRGQFLPEKEYKGVDSGERFRKGPYGSQTECHAAFAAMVDYLDTQVGEIVAKLKELGVYDNTLIIFTSDNGPHLEGGADPDYFGSNGPLKGYKRDLYEGGIRVPMIAVWQGKIIAGSESDHPSSFWDVLPTVAEILGFQAPNNIDGISFLPTLLGKEQSKHDYMYWEFHEMGGRQALRKGDWKLVVYNVENPEKKTVELFNVQADPGEENNLAADKPALVEELQKLMDGARTESEVFPFKINNE